MNLIQIPATSTNVLFKKITRHFTGTSFTYEKRVLCKEFRLHADKLMLLYTERDAYTNQPKARDFS